MVDHSPNTTSADAYVSRIAQVVQRRWDHNRCAPWLDDRSPHYGDVEHFVWLVLEAVVEEQNVKCT
jgi:hypothetical protein